MLDPQPFHIQIVMAIIKQQNTGYVNVTSITHECYVLDTKAKEYQGFESVTLT